MNARHIPLGGVVLLAGLFASLQSYVPGETSPGAQSGKGQRSAQSSASAKLVAAFPGTRALLTHLEKTNPDALARVLETARSLPTATTRRNPQAALQLAREHHPELAKLLGQLERDDRKSYDAAMRSLMADAARLARAQARSVAAYDTALAAWKLRSRTRLAAARLQHSQDPKHERRLSALLLREEQAKLRTTQRQIRKLEKQLQTLRQRLERDPHESVRRQIRTIKKRFNNKKKAK